MGKQISVTKFRGLVTNPNALTTADGAMEQATNICIAQPDLLTKRRGFRSVAKCPSNFKSFGLYTYLGLFYEGHVSTQEVDVSVVSPVTPNPVEIAAFELGTNVGALVYSWRPYVTVESYAANASWIAVTKYEMRRVTATGLVRWDTFRAIPTAPGVTAAISGNFLWPLNHDAQGTFNTAVGGTFGMVPFGARAHVLFHTLSPFKSYILTHEPFTTTAGTTTSRSGVSQALDCDAIPGPDALTDRYAGPIRPNCQVSYRIVFLKRYADGTEVFGAPSPICTVLNPKRLCTSVTDQTTEWRFNAPVNDLEGNTFAGNETVFLYGDRKSTRLNSSHWYRLQ
jgi:hypothetical protein